MDELRLAEELIHDEGLRLTVYKCPAGKWTIGVGRNLEDRGISEDEARLLLMNDIAFFRHGLSRALPWLEAAPRPVQDVLANMAFNMGLAGLLAFRRTLAHIQAGRYNQAADEMLRSRWAQQVGGRAERLAAVLRSLSATA